jgi:hypothetical protein
MSPAITSAEAVILTTPGRAIGRQISNRAVLALDEPHDVDVNVQR